MSLRTQMCMVAVTVIALGHPANAHFVKHRDPDDIEGKLDIRRSLIEPRLVGDVRTLDVTVRTHDRFHRGDLVTGGFYVDFDSRGDGARDFTLQLGLWKDGSLYCSLADRRGFSRAGGDEEKGPRSYSCSFDRSELNATRSIRWRVRSGNGGTEDSAPQQGWYAH
ncbi:MAG: hypothetical protein M3280_12600 [Actinomycetota bacterium]|nr:hypothetical protein [Actinomycetota bacterium]